MYFEINRHSNTWIWISSRRKWPSLAKQNNGSVGDATTLTLALHWIELPSRAEPSRTGPQFTCGWGWSSNTCYSRIIAASGKLELSAASHFSVPTRWKLLLNTFACTLTRASFNCVHGKHLIEPQSFKKLLHSSLLIN